MNILYIGLESANWVINLCNEFCKLGNKVTCLVQDFDEYDKENPASLHQNLTRINLSSEDINSGSRIRNKLLLTLSNEKFDIIFGSHAPVSSIIKELAKSLSIPWGVMILDIPTDLMKNDRKRMINWLHWFDDLKCADVVLFNTFVARDEYYNYTHQYFPEENVIPYGVNMPEEYDSAGLDVRGDYVLSVCRLTFKKNCNLIARALAYLDKPLKYVAVGRDKGDLINIKNICKVCNIDFEHFENVTEKEKFELIKKSSMVIYPQDSEYIAGLSPLEAMYVGKPVIVLDFKILKDLYKDYAICVQNEPMDLAREISFVNNLNSTVIREHLIKANKYVKGIASFKVMAARMINIFEKVVGGKV